MLRINRAYGIVAVGLGAVTVLAACGSSSSSSAAPTSSSTGGSASAIQAKIMVAGDITSTFPFTTPEIVPTVKGVLRNLPGVQIVVCDSKGTQAGAQACELQAVQGHVAAVVSAAGYIAQNQAMLAKAGIPVIGTTDTTSADSFATTSFSALYVAQGVGLAKAGCTKVGTLFTDGQAPVADSIKQGVVSQGAQEVVRAAVPVNAADLAPSVAKITGAGADCVAVSLPPTAAAQVLTAIKQSGKTLTVAGISAVFSQQVIDSLGALTNGLLVVDSQLNQGDTSAAVQQVAADVKSESSTAPVTEFGIMAWVSAKLVAAALPKVQGAVTASSMLTALNGLRNVDLGGVIAPWSSVELNNQFYKRLFNHYGINYKIENGKAVRDGDFYDIGPILQSSN
jgi:ABC-type branched-subunit amino acid transport system substrate-binding protein